MKRGKRTLRRGTVWGAGADNENQMGSRELFVARLNSEGDYVSATEFQKSEYGVWHANRSDRVAGRHRSCLLTTMIAVRTLGTRLSSTLSSESLASAPLPPLPRWSADDRPRTIFSLLSEAGQRLRG